MAQAKLKNKFGFTIVEMLLVTVLIVLLIGLVGGIYTRSYKKAVVKKSARNFLLAAKYARILAIERQSECKLELNINDNHLCYSCWIMYGCHRSD